MHKTDHLSLDGHLMQLFVLVYESGSVSRTAERLGVNQSSVSHGLERLRRIVGDPLFVRSGRGIAATPRADELVETARTLLAELEGFVEPGRYDPEEDEGVFTVAANDYEVETILRPLLAIFRADAPQVTLQVLRAYSRKDWAALLRNNEADLVLAPTLQASESDLAQQTLFQDHHVCLFDPAARSVPDSLAAYCDAPHAVMLPGRLGPTEIDRTLAARKMRRHTSIAAPSFAMLAAMIKGTDIIATMPSRLATNLFSDFEAIPSPIETKPFSIAQIWHCRNSTSARHRWLRQSVRSTVS